jgi:hypothetical protein
MQNHQTSTVGTSDVELTVGIQVELPTPQHFLQVAETLTRVGIQRGEYSLEQVAHILHRRGRYYILHWREVEYLDTSRKNSTSNFCLSQDDLAMMRVIVGLLEKWNLVKRVGSNLPALPDVGGSASGKLKSIKFSEKNKWVLSRRVVVGKFKGNRYQSFRRDVVVEGTESV